MKHIKKYRKVLSPKEQEFLRNKARQKTKTFLSNKYKKEYLEKQGKEYRKLRREYIKQLNKEV